MIRVQFDQQGNIIRSLRYGDLRPHFVCPDCYWHHGWHWPTCPSSAGDTCPDWCEMAPGRAEPPAASDGTVGRRPMPAVPVPATERQPADDAEHPPTP